MIYQFDLPDDAATAVAQISVGNQFVIEIASGTDGEFVKERDYVAEPETRFATIAICRCTRSRLPLPDQCNPQKIVRIRLSDGLPSDGWGPY